MREQNVDLKLISGDARQTVTAVAHAVGVPRDAGVIEGPDLPADNEGLAAAAESNTIFCRITPDQKKALVGALAERGRFTAMIGDGVNDVPALKQARLAVAMGSGSQITKGIADIVLLSDQFSMLPRAVAEGRRIARNIHRLGRLYLTKTVYAGDPDPDHRDLRLHLPLPAPPAHGRGPADDRHPLLRARARAERGPPLPRAACSGRWRPSPCPPGPGSPLGSLLSLLPRRQRLRRHPGRGPNGRDHDADRARPLLHPPARTRPGPRAHHHSELHARHGRRPRRPLRPDPRGGAGARLLRPRAALGRPVVPLLSCASRSAWCSPRSPGASPTSRCSRRPRSPSRARRRPSRRHVHRRNPAEHAGPSDGSPTREARMRPSDGRRRTKIVATIGPATRSVESMAELITAGADVFRLNFSHGTRDEHAENVAMAREASRAGRPRGRPPRRPARARSSASTRSRAASSSSARARRSRSRPARRSAPPTTCPSLGRPSRRRSTRARRSTSPTAGSACAPCARRPGEIRCAVEVGGRGRLAPGAQPARDRRRRCRRRAARTWTGSTSR